VEREQSSLDVQEESQGSFAVAKDKDEATVGKERYLKTSVCCNACVHSIILFYSVSVILKCWGLGQIQ
jgi:hypothetical protein